MYICLKSDAAYEMKCYYSVGWPFVDFPNIGYNGFINEQSDLKIS